MYIKLLKIVIISKLVIKKLCLSHTYKCNNVQIGLHNFIIITYNEDDIIARLYIIKIIRNIY